MKKSGERESGSQKPAGDSAAPSDWALPSRHPRRDAVPLPILFWFSPVRMLWSPLLHLNPERPISYCGFSPSFQTTKQAPGQLLISFPPHPTAFGSQLHLGTKPASLVTSSLLRQLDSFLSSPRLTPLQYFTWLAVLPKSIWTLQSSLAFLTVARTTIRFLSWSI